MKEFTLWKSILKSLYNKKKVALLIVAESSNSSPGKQGFKMAVNEDGVLYGTIGGGIMEKNLITEAKEYLGSKSKTILKTLYHHTIDQKDSSGLICGGKQTFIFVFLNKSNIDIVNKIILALELQTGSVLFVKQNGIEFQFDSEQTNKFIFHYTNEKLFEYIERYGITDTVYIIGGGHVGLALSKVMSNLDFYIVIIDQREKVFTMDENIFVHKKIIMNYDSIDGVIKDSNNSYVVIVTPQHVGDEAALKSVIHKNVKYIGMMGSKKKIKTIFDNLIKSGVDKELLGKVHSPIGLEIGAQTPDEIAISIGAEIIKEKYRTN